MFPDGLQAAIGALEATEKNVELMRALDEAQVVSASEIARMKFLLALIGHLRKNPRELDEAGCCNDAQLTWMIYTAKRAVLQLADGPIPSGAIIRQGFLELEDRLAQAQSHEQLLAVHKRITRAALRARQTIGMAFDSRGRWGEAHYGVGGQLEAEDIPVDASRDADLPTAVAALRKEGATTVIGIASGLADKEGKGWNALRWAREKILPSSSDRGDIVLQPRTEKGVHPIESGRKAMQRMMPALKRKLGLHPLAAEFQR